MLLRAPTLLSLAICLGVGLLVPLLVRAIDTPPEITGDAVAYLWIVTPGMALNAYIVAATAVLRAYGRTLRILVLGLVVNLLDVAMIATLVLVLELGVVGAPLPTLLIRGLGALRSAGGVTVPMALSIGTTVLVLLPLSWLLVPVAGLGLAGAWWALLAAEAVKAALLALHWRSRAWVPRRSVAERTTQAQEAQQSSGGVPMF